MAGYRTHIAVSGLLGAGYCVLSVTVAGFSAVHGALAGFLAGIAGMLPDLDSDSGRPVRELFGLVAAVAPLVLMQRLETWGGGRDAALLLAVLLYLAIRYGASGLLKMVTVHRGMFHSIPALLIAAELTFLAYASQSISVRLLMALAVALGFGSHLLLDELHSMTWDGTLPRLKASAGSALKLAGPAWGANIVAYGLMFTLGYGVLVDGGLLKMLSRRP